MVVFGTFFFRVRLPPPKSREVNVRDSNKRPMVSSGIAGLDDILRGGLPASNLYILQRPPGSGKTTAALQFLRAGVAQGERCIYFSLSQTRAELEAIAQSHGWTMHCFRVSRALPGA